MQQFKTLIYQNLDKDLVLLYSIGYPTGALLTQEGYSRLLARMTHEDKQTHVKTLIDPTTAAYLKAELIDA